MGRDLDLGYSGIDLQTFVREEREREKRERKRDKYRTAHPSKHLAEEHSILANVGVNKIQTGRGKQNEHNGQDRRHSRRDIIRLHQRLGSPRTQSCGPPRIRQTSWNAPRHMQEGHQPTYHRGYRGNRGTAPRRCNSRNGFPSGSKPYRGYNNIDFITAFPSTQVKPLGSEAHLSLNICHYQHLQ